MSNTTLPRLCAHCNRPSNAPIGVQFVCCGYTQMHQAPLEGTTTLGLVLDGLTHLGEGHNYTPIGGPRHAAPMPARTAPVMVMLAATAPAKGRHAAPAPVADSRYAGSMAPAPMFSACVHRAGVCPSCR